MRLLSGYHEVTTIFSPIIKFSDRVHKAQFCSPIVLFGISCKIFVNISKLSTANAMSFDSLCFLGFIYVILWSLEPTSWIILMISTSIASVRVTIKKLMPFLILFSLDSKFMAIGFDVVPVTHDTKNLTPGSLGELKVESIFQLNYAVIVVVRHSSARYHVAVPWNLQWWQA